MSGLIVDVSPGAFAVPAERPREGALHVGSLWGPRSLLIISKREFISVIEFLGHMVSLVARDLTQGKWHCRILRVLLRLCDSSQAGLSAVRRDVFFSQLVTEPRGEDSRFPGADFFQPSDS